MLSELLKQSWQLVAFDLHDRTSGITRDQISSSSSSQGPPPSEDVLDSEDEAELVDSIAPERPQTTAPKRANVFHEAA